MLQLFMQLVPIGIVGIGGWFIAQYFGHQVVQFYKLRGDAAEVIYFVENIGMITLEDNKDRHDSACDELRRCAARFVALQKNATRLTKKYLSFKRYDLSKTVKGLTGLSNSLSTWDYPRHAAQHLVEVGLRLSPSLTGAELEEERKLYSQPGSGQSP